MLARKAQTGLLNLQTAGMDELSAAVWKATTDDLFEPKEKHVAAIVRAAAEADGRAALVTPLLKRVHTCGVRPVTAAKTLYLLHKLTLMGADDLLAQPREEMAAILARGGLPAVLVDYASYVLQLCTWDDASVFRNADAPAFWRGMHLAQVLKGLPPVQALLDAAFALALEDREVSTPAQASLHLAVAEDAFALFRCEAAAAAVLWDGLLALPPELADRQPGGVLPALETAARHGADALMLQRVLGSWRGGSGALSTPARLSHVIEHQLPWSESRAQGAAAAAAAAGAAASAVARGQSVPVLAAPSPTPGVASPAPLRPVRSHPLGTPPQVHVNSPGSTAPTTAVNGVHSPLVSSLSLQVPALALQRQQSPPRFVSRATAATHLTSSWVLPLREQAPLHRRSSGASVPAEPGPGDMEVAPVLSKEQLSLNVGLPAPKSVQLTPGSLQHQGSSTRVSAEWSAAGLLPPAPVAPAPMLPPLAVELSASDLRAAAYEVLLIGASAGGKGIRATSAVAAQRGGMPATQLCVSDHVLATVRTRLGLTLRIHRRLMALLRLDATPTYGAMGSVSHRAQLILEARIATAGTIDLNADDVRAFVSRQIKLLLNALAACGADEASLERLEQTANALLAARCDTAGVPAAAHTSGQPGDLVPLSLEAAAEESFRGALADVGLVVQSPGEAFGAEAVGVASCGGTVTSFTRSLGWPAVLAARLYCHLLAACYESSEADAEGFAKEATDADAVLAALKCTWSVLPMDADAEELCRLIVAFERYAEAEGTGATLLAGPVRRALDATLAHVVNAHGEEAISSCGPRARTDPGSWAETSRSHVFAAIVSLLGGKLRDYRGHYAIDVAEMKLAVGIWAQCMLFLQPAGTSSESSAHILRAQARQLIDASMGRHVKRLRLALGRSGSQPPTPTGSRVDSTEPPSGDASPRTAAATSARLARVSWRVSSIAAAVCDEIEVEPEFAECFDTWIDDIDTDGMGTGSGQRSTFEHGSRGSNSGGAGGALSYALRVLERELDDDLRSAVTTFTTLEGHAMAAVRALAPLAATMRATCGEAALKRARELCAAISSGWCAQLEGLLYESMLRAIRLETWQPISAVAEFPRSSSAIDVFTQLDQLADVFIAFASLQPLQPADLRAFTDVAERHVTSYARALVDECAPLPHSDLEGDARTPTLAGVAAAPDKRIGRSSLTKAYSAHEDAAAAVKGQSVEQICLRLNNCLWARTQLTSLGAKLVKALPELSALASTRAGGGGVEDLMSAGINGVETACSAIVRYIARRAIYFELEQHFVASLYLPSPSEPRARLAPLLDKLSPILVAIVRGIGEKEWRQKALSSILGNFSHALSAILEAPNRSYGPEHRRAIRKDLDQLSEFFMDGGILDKEMVLYSVSPLFALADGACEEGAT